MRSCSSCKQQQNGIRIRDPLRFAVAFFLWWIYISIVWHAASQLPAVNSRSSLFIYLPCAGITVMRSVVVDRRWLPGSAGYDSACIFCCAYECVWFISGKERRSTKGIVTSSSCFSVLPLQLGMTCVAWGLLDVMQACDLSDGKSAALRMAKFLPPFIVQQKYWPTMMYSRGAAEECTLERGPWEHREEACVGFLPEWKASVPRCCLDKKKAEEKWKSCVDLLQNVFSAS